MDLGALARYRPKGWSRAPIEVVRRTWEYLTRRRLAMRGRRDPYGPLSVGELILQLQRFDPDMRVLMPGAGRDWTDVYEAHVDLFVINKEWGLGLADERDSDAFNVVRLFGSPDD